MRQPGKLYQRYIDFVCRRRGVSLFVLLLACTVPAWLTVRLFQDVRADLQELMPQDAPAARALNEIHARLGSQGHLTIVAHGRNPDANRGFIDAISKRLRSLQLPMISRVQGDVRAEREWLQRRAPLILPPNVFDGVIDDVESLINRAKAQANPLFVSLDEEASQEGSWETLEQRLKQQVGSRDRFPNGYLETPDGQTVVALVWIHGSDVDIDLARTLMAAVRAEVDVLIPQFPPDLRVSYTGDAANFIEEHEAILADISLTSLVVLVLVTVLVALYFRSLRSVLVVLCGLAPGLLFAFGIGKLLVGHLNSNTAFLGSIIAGNGVNYPLILLSYYRARRLDEAMPTALMAAAVAALPGTLGAAATASAAYGGLAISSFRGFSQFGYLGGVGMITTWLWTFLTIPIAVAWFHPPRQPWQASSVQLALHRFFAGPWPKLVGALFVAVTVTGAAWGVGQGIRGGVYEMHLEVLRNRRSLAGGSASWEKKMTELFGSWVNPIVALVEEPENREPTAEALRKSLTATDPPAIDRVETIETFLPAVNEQQRRLVRLSSLKRRIEGLPSQDVPEEAQAYLDQWLSEPALRPIDSQEIPPTLVRTMREKAGGLDRTILIYPSTTVDYADGHNMIWLSKQIQAIPLPDKSLVGGPFLFMASMFELVHAEAPKVVGFVFCLVLVLLVPLYCKRPGRIVMTGLIVGPVALLSQSMVLAAGVRVNMLNFAAVPITIGVGADYLLNLFGAMDSLKLDARAACARMGGAILLCSLTTIVGYGSLLLAHSGALRSFGWAAVLGEIVAVVVVLLVLPAYWRGTPQ